MLYDNVLFCFLLRILLQTFKVSTIWKCHQIRLVTIDDTF